MIWFYNIGITLYNMLLYFAALFNNKAKLFVEGRKNIWAKIEAKIDPNSRPIWFHFASLGEFEQGRPVLEHIKSTKPNQKVIITFFSPSGYQIRKNYPLADGVFYLPLDTAAHAKKFIALVNPAMAIFTKYEFWHHYFQALKQNNVPLYLISGIFRKNQAFFKWYGSFNRGMLKCIDYFFVQNQESKLLLNGIGIHAVEIAGDTRFDRVHENAQQPKKIELIEKFCAQSNVCIAGSTWLADEKLLVHLINQYPDWKFIIVPHEIGDSHIQEIESLYPKAIKYSDLPAQSANHLTQILIINNIGLLASLYQYGQIAYIGGGFGAGIHNTLEAAAFGLPVIFGPKYHKFQEAKDLIEIGSAKSISCEEGLLAAFEYFKDNSPSSVAAKNYVETNKGATQMILKVIYKNL